MYVQVCNSLIWRAFWAWLVAFPQQAWPNSNGAAVEVACFPEVSGGVLGAENGKNVALGMTVGFLRGEKERVDVRSLPGSPSARFSDLADPGVDEQLSVVTATIANRRVIR